MVKDSNNGNVVSKFVVSSSYSKEKMDLFKLER